MNDLEKGSSSFSSTLNELKVEELAFYYEEMARSHLVELDIETPFGRLVLKRYQKEAASKSVPLRRKTDFQLEKDEPVSANAKVISSPIMGIFYRSSSPQSPPFVKEGETVESGVTLCIVEAMKVMNEIKSDARCKVLKILAENGKPVSKGQSLFQIEHL